MNIDIAFVIEAVIVVALVYILVKFIVSPVIKIAIGILIILLFLYIMQRLLGFDANRLLTPFGISVNFNSWGINFDWLLNPLNYYIDKIKHFFIFIWSNVPRTTTPGD